MALHVPTPVRLGGYRHILVVCSEAPCWRQLARAESAGLVRRCPGAMLRRIERFRRILRHETHTQTEACQMPAAEFNLQSRSGPNRGGVPSHGRPAPVPGGVQMLPPMTKRYSQAAVDRRVAGVPQPGVAEGGGIVRRLLVSARISFTIMSPNWAPGVGQRTGGVAPLPGGGDRAARRHVLLLELAGYSQAALIFRGERYLRRVRFLNSGYCSQWSYLVAARLTTWRAFTRSSSTWSTRSTARHSLTPVTVRTFYEATRPFPQRLYRAHVPRLDPLREPSAILAAQGCRRNRCGTSSSRTSTAITRGPALLPQARLCTAPPPTKC